MDNVYYPIFLGFIWYTVMTVEYAGNCIIDIGASVEIPLKNESFSLGKARERVLSFSQLSTLYPQLYPQPFNLSTTTL